SAFGSGIWPCDNLRTSLKKSHSRIQDRSRLSISMTHLLGDCVKLVKVSPACALRFALLAVCVLECATGTARAQNASKPEAVQSVVVAGTRAPSSWLRAESPHFVVWTDTSSADATRLLDQLERLDALLRLYTAPIRKADTGAAQKLTMYYLDGQSGFTRF